MLLNEDSIRTKVAQCITIKFRLQTENLSINKHVISDAGIEHKVVVGTSKVKGTCVQLCYSCSF